MKQLLNNTIVAGLMISMPFAASAKLTTEKLFENLRIQPLSEFTFDEVQNLNLKLTIRPAALFTLTKQNRLSSLKASY